MIERVVPSCLLAALLAFSTGCVCTHPGMLHGGMAADGCGVACPPSGRAGHLGCNAGCGDVYVDEWCSDPPSSCGPCDTGPKSIGAGCCGWWNPLQGLSHLWGYRYSPMGFDGGCATCGETAMMSGYEGEMMMPSFEGKMMAPEEASPPAGEEGDSLIPPAPSPVEDTQASRGLRKPAPRFTTAGTRQTVRR